ncbi:unnamed protein product [Macrosiphum euphorbiae]|uniref:Uncharacterized protein n=1 Tax=Macrosiphum euphorbiae TaxID=13131 RepID=A0AAV0VLP3_9HEMI|nr:unnamed protein product [Macrosiphum euphorbiae]
MAAGGGVNHVTGDGVIIGRSAACRRTGGRISDYNSDGIKIGPSAREDAHQSIRVAAASHAIDTAGEYQGRFLQPAATWAANHQSYSLSAPTSAAAMAHLYPSAKFSTLLPQSTPTPHHRCR